MTKRRQPVEPFTIQASWHPELKAKLIADLGFMLEDPLSQDVSLDEAERALAIIEHFEQGWQNRRRDYPGFVEIVHLNQPAPSPRPPIEPVTVRHAEPVTVPQLGDREALMPRADVMKLLRCGRSKIYTLEAQGKLTPIRPTAMAKSHVFYSPREVDAILNGR